MNVPAPAPFDVCGPLPGAGVTVLEASAGTGKTFTIAALVTRFVAEGVRLPEILAVTFTRMATGELRERVRDRLVAVHAHLDRFLAADVAVPAEDEVAVVIATGTREEVVARRDRMANAISGFDEATITTTHGFCQLVLSSMGVAGGASPGTTLLEDPSDLVEEVVDDLYLRRALQYGKPPFSRSAALTVAKEALRSPDIALEPPEDSSVPGRLARLASAARAEVDRRLRDEDLLTFDGLLLRLRDLLVDPERGAGACRRLAEQYRVVLIDEFQDTDPVQWEVVSNAFGGGDTVLVLIGDPKQAIYAFRGADVYAYLAASAAAASRFTLEANYRSDHDLLQSFDALLSPLFLGHPGIPYRIVRSSLAHQQPGLHGAPSNAALRVRLLYDDQSDIARTAAKRLPQKQAAVEWVATDLAADVVDLLSSGAELVEHDGDGRERSRRQIGARDVGVLVRINRQAAVVHEALRAVGVPAVVASSLSVYRTPAATEWLRLLEALEDPASRSRVVAVALGPFVGMSAQEVSEATDAEMEELHFLLRRLEAVLRRAGVAALFRATLAEGRVPSRLLVLPDGERQMTDLAHLAELLGAEATAAQLGLPRLRALLARRITEPGVEDAEERTRRLDSDAEAVQILTVHRAKGLEFPVVYCPYLWDAGMDTPAGNPVVFHDSSDGERRKLDVGSGGVSSQTTAYKEHFAVHRDEERGEQLRNLYVALTRAKHQAVIWWAGVDKSQHSALGRLLFSRDADGNVAAGGGSLIPKSADVVDRLEALATAVSDHFVVERAVGENGLHWTPGAPAFEDLQCAPFGREIDQTWRRSSYSAITADVYDELVGSEPETRGTTDEPDPAEADESADPGESEGAEDLRRRCPLGEMPAGADVGTIVHSVLERVDFTDVDLEAQLTATIELEQARHGSSLGELNVAVAGLAAALRSPLGPIAEGVRLCDVPRADRLDELGFEFPVAGGDTSRASVTVSALAEVLARHVGPGAALAGYAARLADPTLERELRGYLSGSIDLVLRHPAGGDERYFVVDYKSNRLAPAGEDLLAWHYRPEALDQEMQRFHYPLQALIYDVALHRYLRWRLTGYDPARHLGGVLYLFLRGMLGADTPQVDGAPCGVFAWRPSAALIEELSDVLDAGVEITREAS
jgi:exodeoxyribonuclease V beta subunit